MVQPAKKKGKNPDAKKQNRVGRKGFVNEAQKLVLLTKVWEAKVAGYNLREIGELIADYLDLPNNINPSTIMGWLDEAQAVYTRKIGKLRDEFVGTAIPRLEKKIKHWLPYATGEKTFVVARMEKIGDEYVEVIDENVIREQALAANVCQKSIEQMRRILGVGLKAGEGEPGQGAINMTQINQLLVQFVQQGAAKPGETLGASPLALEAGDELIEKL